MLRLVAVALVMAMGSFAESMEDWDSIDMKGDARISMVDDYTAPPGFGPSVISVEGDHVIALAKGERMTEGTLLLLYREMDLREKDADGLLVCYADYEDSVAEEHNTKRIRPHMWFEQDNDSGAQLRSVDGEGKETLIAEKPGVGLITSPWNETDWIWQKVEFGDGRVRAKFWPAHEAEPAEWSLSGIYDGPRGERVGIRMGSGHVHIAHFVATQQPDIIDAPYHWLYPVAERYPRGGSPSFVLYRGDGGPNEIQGLSIGNDEIRLKLDEMLERFTIGSAGSNSDVSIEWPADLDDGVIRVALKGIKGSTLSQTRVVQVNTDDLVGRIQRVDQRIESSLDLPYGQSAKALAERAQSLVDAGDFESAKRSVAYAEEVAAASTPLEPRHEHTFEAPEAAADVQVRDGQIFVNGEPFIVKGVNVHSLDAGSEERSRRMLEILKGLGFNMLRGDYPPRWQVEMAHEMGMAWSVLAPFSCCSTDEVFARYDSAPMVSALDTAVGFIDDYADLPGVLLWNSCNEIGNDTTDFLVAMYPLYGQRDPYNRPVHYANLYGQDRHEGQDIMAVNYYFGVGQTPEDRQPIIQQSIDIAKRHNMPIIYTEYNSYHGPIPEKGVEAIYGLFQWGLDQGMSGGFFYMKVDSSTHPGVFNDNLETHPETDAAFIDVFADARIESATKTGEDLVLRIKNKREFFLRDVSLSGENFETIRIADFEPMAVREVSVPLGSGFTEFEGVLEFVTHRHFPCRVPLRADIK